MYTLRSKMLKTTNRDGTDLYRPAVMPAYVKIAIRLGQPELSPNFQWWLVSRYLRETENLNGNFQAYLPPCYVQCTRL